MAVRSVSLDDPNWRRHLSAERRLSHDLHALTEVGWDFAYITGDEEKAMKDHGLV
ncbi:hypothetical protein [Neorhizobium petrolearium]|uniref:hypothetical protein n=1 Tax=Neorhizobium petrolearium TaxID=515361 RepID=UPI001AE106B0|nr:hypothetical protein [Neorhizobium petrolearium]